MGRIARTAPPLGNKSAFVPFLVWLRPFSLRTPQLNSAALVQVQSLLLSIYDHAIQGAVEFSGRCDLAHDDETTADGQDVVTATARKANSGGCDYDS